MEGNLKEQDATKLPWRVEADSPPCFGPDGFTVWTMIYDARHRRVLRLCPAGTRGPAVAQAQAAAMAMVALSIGAAKANDALPAPPAPRRTFAAGADPTAEAPRP